MLLSMYRIIIVFVVMLRGNSFDGFVYDFIFCLESRANVYKETLLDTNPTLNEITYLFWLINLSIPYRFTLQSLRGRITKKEECHRA